MHMKSVFFFQTVVISKLYFGTTAFQCLVQQSGITRQNKASVELLGCNPGIFPTRATL